MYHLQNYAFEKFNHFVQLTCSLSPEYPFQPQNRHLLISHTLNNVSQSLLVNMHIQRHLVVLSSKSHYHDPKP